MKPFLRVAVDARWPIGLVTYRSADDHGGARVLRRDRDGRIRPHSLREHAFVESGVMIHETQRDQVIEIEILDVDDPVMVALARDYARDNGLEFPSDIRAAAKAPA